MEFKRKLIALLGLDVDDCNQSIGINNQLIKALFDRFGSVTEEEANNFCGLLIEGIKESSIKMIHN